MQDNKHVLTPPLDPWTSQREFKDALYRLFSSIDGQMVLDYYIRADYYRQEAVSLDPQVLAAE